MLRGECLLIVDGREVPLRQWDYFHCPPDVAHAIVGAGTRPSLVLAVGNRIGLDVTLISKRDGVEARSGRRAGYAAAERCLLPLHETGADTPFRESFWRASLRTLWLQASSWAKGLAPACSCGRRGRGGSRSPAAPACERSSARAPPRSSGDVELLGDPAVGAAFGDEREHFDLAWSQLRERGATLLPRRARRARCGRAAARRPRRGRRRSGLEKPGQQSAAQPRPQTPSRKARYRRVDERAPVDDRSRRRRRCSLGDREPTTRESTAKCGEWTEALSAPPGPHRASGRRRRR